MFVTFLFPREWRPGMSLHVRQSFGGPFSVQHTDWCHIWLLFELQVSLGMSSSLMVHTSILTMLLLLQGHLLMWSKVSFSLWWSKGSSCSDFFALISAWYLNKIPVLQRFSHSGGCRCNRLLAERKKSIAEYYRIWEQNCFSNFLDLSVKLSFKFTSNWVGIQLELLSKVFWS